MGTENIASQEGKMNSLYGWQTLNPRSVLAHVRMPEAFTVQVGLFESGECKYLRECLIGRPPQPGRPSMANDLTGIEEVHSEMRLVDAVYTRLRISWRGIVVDVQSARDDQDLLLLIEPVSLPNVPVLLTVEAGVLWDRPGGGERCGNQLLLHGSGSETRVHATETPVHGGHFPAIGAHMALPLDRPLGICTGRQRTLAEVRIGIAKGLQARDAGLDRFGGARELAGAMSTALGWTTVHNAVEDRLTTVCSRVWASRNAGGILFCWDTFFAAMMAASLGEGVCARAYCDAIVDTINDNGYVPNVHNAVGSESIGQSQPPVGSLAVRYCAQALGNEKFAEPYLDRLLMWNRFWEQKRDVDGFLCWGSNHLPPRSRGRYEMNPGNLQGAKFESGLDNSPMFDSAQFDAVREVMLQADVGLMALYIRDCFDLADLCRRAGRGQAAEELVARGNRYASKLDELWDEKEGLFLNRDLATGQPSLRLSPTLFYPLLTGLINPQRVQRMITDHLLNPAEFWGKHVVPSISRSDPAFADQDYWRGRIWAPLNLLVYLGLVEAGKNGASGELASKSESLFLRAWRQRGFIGENYNAMTGDTGEKSNSDPFNPWGALLALVALMDSGKVVSLPRCRN